MSSRLPAALAVAALLVASARPASARAPQEPPSEDEVIRRIETLQPQVAQARADLEEALRLQRLEEQQRAHPPMDTVTVGPLRIVTPPEQADLARELFDKVWRESFPNVERSPSLASTLFTFQWKVSPRSIYMLPPEDGGAPVTRVELYRMSDRSRASVERRVREAVSRTLGQDFRPGSPMDDWLWGYHPGDLDATGAYRQLALTAGLGGAFRDCLGGDPSACWTADGLGRGEAARALASSFSLDERVSMVRRAAEATGYFERGGVRSPLRDSGDVEACIVQRSEDACDRPLTPSLKWSLDNVGGGTAMRWTLFWHAIELGGEGAWRRALERADAAPADVLTYVSGMDADDLATSWLADLEAHRPEIRADLAVTRWAVFFWVLVFMALALRSTRWRLR